MTACVQKEKLKAKSSAKTPEMIAQTRSLTMPPLQSSIIQRNMLDPSSATKPTANAPHKPLKRFTSQAALPMGSNWNSQANSVQSG